nr:unknown [Ipomoea trifida]
MGFCPYFLHEKSSGGISAIFMLIAGTLVTVFCLNFLYQLGKMCVASPGGAAAALAGEVILGGAALPLQRRRRKRRFSAGGGQGQIGNLKSRGRRRLVINFGVDLRLNRQRRNDGGSPEPGVTRPSPTEKINHLLKLINRNIRHHFNLHRRFLPALRRLMLLLRQQSDERMNALEPRRRLLHHRTLLQLLREGEINTPAVSAVSVIHHKVHCHGRPNQRNRENVIWNKSQNDAIGEAKEKKKGRGVDDKVDSR